MKVRELMHEAVVSVPPDTPVPRARALMQRERIRHLLVMDGPRLSGIVTDRDIRLNLPSPATTLSVWEMNALLERQRVEEIMQRSVVTIGPDRDVYEAAQLMIDHRIGGLPVTEEGQVMGIVTETDLLRALIALRVEPARGGRST
jgi:CBS domain-containing protein